MEILIKSRLFGYEIISINENDLNQYEKIDTKAFGKITNDFKEIIEHKPIYIKKATS